MLTLLSATEEQTGSTWILYCVWNYHQSEIWRLFLLTSLLLSGLPLWHWRIITSIQNSIDKIIYIPHTQATWCLSGLLGGQFIWAAPWQKQLSKKESKAQSLTPTACHTCHHSKIISEQQAEKHWAPSSADPKSTGKPWLEREMPLLPVREACAKSWWMGVR